MGAGGSRFCRGIGGSEPRKRFHRDGLDGARGSRRARGGRAARSNAGSCSGGLRSADFRAAGVRRPNLATCPKREAKSVAWLFSTRWRCADPARRRHGPALLASDAGRRRKMAAICDRGSQCPHSAVPPEGAAFAAPVHALRCGRALFAAIRVRSGKACAEGYLRARRGGAAFRSTGLYEILGPGDRARGIARRREFRHAPVSFDCRWAHPLANGGTNGCRRST